MGRRVAPLEHINLILSQHVFALTNGSEVTNTHLNTKSTYKIVLSERFIEISVVLIAYSYKYATRVWVYGV